MTDFFEGLGYAQNATNPTTRIDVTPGYCRDALNQETINLASSITKNVTTPFAAGDGNGSLDTGSIGTGYYWIHVIWNATTEVADVLTSLSLNAPVLPSGFTSRRVIGGFAYISGIVGFINVGDWHYYKTRIVSVSNAYNNSSPAARLLAVPLGAKCEVQAYLQANDATSANAGFVTVRDPDLGTFTAGAGSGDWFYGVGQYAITRACIMTNTRGQVLTGDNNAGGNGRITIAVEGWRFDRSVYR